jgi:glycosyltransferase involved in cell wall biosynthesis
VAKERIHLTVITAVYNGEEYIEDTINSVLKFAKEVNYQYIVVNDGSTCGPMAPGRLTVSPF